MNTPIPFSVATLDNSPLAGDGSNFLCKQLYDEFSAQVLAKNSIAIRTSRTPSFIDSVVHGGEFYQI